MKPDLMPAGEMQVAPKPQVDVLMTVYNGADYLVESVYSLLKQTLSNFILHIVDDGSVDDTPKILADLARSDPRLRLYTKANSGIVDSSNFGLAHCQAEFVARQDADDISYPDRLQRQFDILTSRPEIVAVSGNAHRIDGRGARLPSDSVTPPPQHADFDFVPAIEPFLIHTFIMYRREAVARVGGYRLLPVSEDSDLFWRLQEIGDLHSDDAFYGQYRMNPQSVSSKAVGNGRIMAVCSQLAALSAKRRRSSRPDLDFDQGLARELGAASHSLESACNVLADQLTSAERDHLRFATSIKLVDMAGYRPYELDICDYSFTKRLCGRYEASVSRHNRKLIHRSLSGVAARLASARKWADVRALLYPSIIPSFLMKHVGRIVLSEKAHAGLRALFRRAKRA